MPDTIDPSPLQSHRSSVHSRSRMYTRIWKGEVSTIVLPSDYWDAEVRLADVGRQRGLIVQVPSFREGLVAKKKLRLAGRLERTCPFIDEYI